jgi:hypothetical protein
LAILDGCSQIDLLIEMPIDKLVEKAEKLLKSRRVEPLSQGTYNVIGDHGTYTVVQDYSGKVSCDCPGFIKNRKCSHATAVIILTASQSKKGINRSRARQRMQEKNK